MGCNAIFGAAIRVSHLFRHWFRFSFLFRSPFQFSTFSYPPKSEQQKKTSIVGTEQKIRRKKQDPKRTNKEHLKIVKMTIWIHSDYEVGNGSRQFILIILQKLTISKISRQDENQKIKTTIATTAACHQTQTMNRTAKIRAKQNEHEIMKYKSDVQKQNTLTKFEFKCET